MNEFNSGDSVIVSGRDGKWNATVLRSEQVVKTKRGRKGSTDQTPTTKMFWRYRVTHEVTGHTEWVTEDCLTLKPLLIGPIQK